MSRKTIEPDPEKWLNVLNDMLDDPDFEFAGDYLAGVKGFVEEHDRITPKQTAAILEIRRSTQ